MDKYFEEFMHKKGLFSEKLYDLFNIMYSIDENEELERKSALN